MIMVLMISFRLKHTPRPKMKLCVIGDERHIDEAKKLGYEHRSMDDLKKLNKDKKLVKKLGMLTKHRLSKKPLFSFLVVINAIIVVDCTSSFQEHLHPLHNYVSKYVDWFDKRLSYFRKFW